MTLALQVAERGSSFTGQELVTVLVIGLTALSLVWSLSRGRMRVPLRPWFDVVRAAIQVVATVAVGLLLDVSTAAAIAAVAMAAGGFLGSAQGRQLHVSREAKRLYVTRSLLGVAIWGGGLVVMQLAALGNRTGIVQIGQAISWFSVGITLGLIFGRQRIVDRFARDHAAVAATAALVLAVVFGGLVGDIGSANAQTPCPDAPGSLVDATGSGADSICSYETNEASSAISIARAACGSELDAEWADLGGGSGTIYVRRDESGSFPNINGEVYKHFELYFVKGSNGIGRVAANSFEGGVAAQYVSALTSLMDAELPPCGGGGTADTDDATGTSQSSVVVVEELPEGPPLVAPLEQPPQVSAAEQPEQRPEVQEEVQPPAEEEPAVVSSVVQAPEEPPTEAEPTEQPPGKEATAQSADETAALEQEIAERVAESGITPDEALQAAIAAALAAAAIGGSVFAEALQRIDELIADAAPPPPAKPAVSAPPPIQRTIPAATTQQLPPPPAPPASPLAGLTGAALVLATALTEAGHSAVDVMEALRKGGIDGLRGLSAGDLPGDSEVGIDYPVDGEILRSRRVKEALDRLPPDVRKRVEERVRAELEADAVAEVMEQARRAIGEVDPSVDDMRDLFRDNPEVEEALRKLPQDVQRQVEADLARQMEQERLDSATADTRAALERQRAADLVRKAIDDGDAEQIDQIMDQLPEDARDDVWDRATKKRPVNYDDMRRAQEPGTGQPAPDNLLPERDIHDVLQDNSEVNEVLDPLPQDVQRQVEERVRSEVDADVAEAALERARRAIGEVDPSVDDMRDLLRDNPEVEEALGKLRPDVRRQVEADLVRRLEQERLDEAADATRAALERRRAIALVREAIDRGDAEQIDQIMDQLPEDARDDVWDQVTGGEGLELGEMSEAQEPGTGQPAPDNLLPEGDIRVAIGESPTVDEVLDPLPHDVRDQVEERVMGELEAEVADAAKEAARRAVGEVDPSVDDMSSLLRDNPEVEEALGKLSQDARQQAEADLVEQLRRERLDAAAAAARRAADLDQTEEAVRRAMSAGEAQRVDAILRGLPPDDAEAISQSIGRNLPNP